MAPIVCAGDIFHKWNSTPELINFALLHLPPMYAIPGQHDLPHHNYEDIRKSAYWTLVQAGRITNLKYGQPQMPNTKAEKKIWLHGIPWGHKLAPLGTKNRDMIHLAVVHRYLWREGHGYPGAPEEERLKNTLPLLKGYTAAVFGDNHSGFLRSGGFEAVSVLNSGGFMRQKSDEKDYKPKIGLLMDDGSIQIHELKSANKDKWEEDVVKALTQDPDKTKEYEDLIDMLEDSGQLALDFGEILRQHLNRKKITKDVRKIILRALEGK